MLALRGSLATMFEDEEPRSSATRLFDALLASLIVANVAGIVFELVELIRREYYGLLAGLDHAATAVFAVEYVLRVWASVDFRETRYHHPVRGRLRYMRSFFALVDLVAVLPAVIGILGAEDLRVLRLLRLLRMLKLVRHSTTFGVLWSVLCEEARSIGALLFILLLTVTISGSLMYLIEGDEQPNVFSSIPAAMWWAIETLTTVGYGDMVPTTVAGRMLGGAVSIVGIGTLALFSGLITIGFLDQLKLQRERSVALVADPGSAVPAVKRQADGAHGGERLEPGELALGGVGAPIIVPAPGVCPHCGVALPVGAAH